MPITLTIEEAVNASVALTRLPKIQNFDVKWDLARIRDMIQDELSPLRQQERELIEEHGGTLSEDGRTITWPEDHDDEKRAAYTKARAALFAKEITIERKPLTRSKVRGSDPAREPDFDVELLSQLRKIIVDDDGAS